jgi:hypothetical protein
LVIVFAPFHCELAIDREILGPVIEGRE